MMRAACLAILSLLLVLAGCGGPGSDLAPLAAGAPGAYALAPGDQVRIITFGEDTLTGEFRVNDSGAVALPLIGAVKAAGKTPAEFEQVVATALRQARLLGHPSVTV